MKPPPRLEQPGPLHAGDAIGWGKKQPSGQPTTQRDKFRSRHNSAATQKSAPAFSLITGGVLYDMTSMGLRQTMAWYPLSATGGDLYMRGCRRLFPAAALRDDGDHACRSPIQPKQERCLGWFCSTRFSKHVEQLPPCCFVHIDVPAGRAGQAVQHQHRLSVGTGFAPVDKRLESQRLGCCQ